MGQVNGKSEPEPQEVAQQQQHKQRAPQERRRPDDLVIQPKATFDSQFTLISPMSELSDPSQFLSKRHNAHETLGLGTEVIHDVPPLPPALQQPRPRDPPEQKFAASRPLLKQKKKKKKKRNKRKSIEAAKKNAVRMKEALAGCAIVSAEHANTMREATTKTAVKCAKKTGHAIKESGVIEKSGVAALNCAAASKAVAQQGAKELSRAVKKGCKQSKLANAELALAGDDGPADILNESECVIVPYQHSDEAPLQFQPVWRESRGMLPGSFPPSNPADAPRGRKEVEDVTPLAVLDRAFATAAGRGLHKEDDYFDRLAGPVAPSPFVHEKEGAQKAQASPSHQTSKAHPDSPVTITSLFSEPSTDGIEVMFSKKANNKNISLYDAGVERTSKHAEKAKKVEQRAQSKLTSRMRAEEKKQASKSTRYATRDELRKRSTLGKGREEIYAPKDAKKNSKKDIFRPKATISAAESQRARKHSYASLKLTESAPSVLEAKDYRSIAWTTSEGAASAPGEVYRPHYTLCSPSVSVCSSSQGTPQAPLVNPQVLSNAAFLFSPSYAGGDEDLLKREAPARDPAFSISTFASRARLSNTSSRSQPAITIPVRQSWAPSLGKSEEEESRDYDFGGHSFGTGKQVRFSDANQLYQIESSLHRPWERNSNARNIKVEREHVEPVFNLPQKIETPIIETKLSDLTDTTFLSKKLNAEEESITTGGSSLSDLSARRISLLSSVEGVSPTSLASNYTENDAASTTSSERQGSIHWTYREENGMVTTTPMVGRKVTTGRALPAASPVIRFRAAKSKFAVQVQKASPVKRTPPKKFAKHTPGKTLVSNRIFELNDRLKSTRQPVSKNPRRDTSGHRVLAPHRANLVNSDVVRNPLTLGVDYAHEDRTIKSATSIDENEQTLFVEENSSGEEDDTFGKSLPSSGNDSSFISVATDASDDPFADIINSNYVAEPEPEPEPETSTQRRPASFSGNSVYSFASSSFGRHSTGTYASKKENSVPLTNLHKVTVKGKVNPTDVYRHDNTRSLCLSPTQRTPMQARKWRTLAAAANEKDKSKKSTAKRGNGRRGLSERNINVPLK